MKELLLDFASAVAPIALDLLSGLVLALIGWAAATINRKTGIEIEEKHRLALHSAVMSGLKAAFAQGITSRAALVTFASEYVAASVPDAVKKLKTSGDVLPDLIESKIMDAIPSDFLPAIAD